jgi:asparagine synthase (glutamine-hydrolysing)|tara:strand:- start:609 stop:1460 length:852 start_codon:yes stop_codon:yes gene_type:complete
MCGIFAYIGNNTPWEGMKNEFERIKYRGPDNTRVSTLENNGIFAFHRLAIMGISKEGNQPMTHPEDDSLTLICNGEIYNYLELAKKYGFQLQTGSDSEIILFMFKQFGIKKTIEELDGVFVFVIHDKNKRQFFSARDPFGVRPGFIGYNKKDVFIASEAKALTNICETVTPFVPGTWWSSTSPRIFNRYYFYKKERIKDSKREEMLNTIKYRLTTAVKKRMMAEREVSALLSGGLDYSLITALVAKQTNSEKLKTFSIGIKGSVDLEYTQLAANYLKTNHFQI